VANDDGRRQAPPRKAPVRSKRPASFYRQALTKAERLALPEAEEIEGLDQEIALLRVKLRTELLVRALTTRYRLPRQSQKDISEAIRVVLREVGGPLYPELANNAA
jgi:hypothetical protein